MLGWGGFSKFSKLVIIFTVFIRVDKIVQYHNLVPKLRIYDVILLITWRKLVLWQWPSG